MFSSLTFFLPLPLNVLDSLVESFQKEFDSYLEESFHEEELKTFEKELDAIAAIYVQPILSELTFEDFYAHSGKEEEQRTFFERCRSSIVLENLPYLETNPFQVTYLVNLLHKFEEVLVDRGGVNDLLFRDDFLQEIEKFKRIDVYTPKPKVLPPPAKGIGLPVDPIDFLIHDVYKELDRLKDVELAFEGLPEKTRKVVEVMKSERLDSLSLLEKSGLNAKDFDDNLERLKFWLRKH